MLMRWCITAPLKHGGNAATNRGPERPDGPTDWLQGKTTLARKAASGWKRQFNNPIPLPRGGRLVTLEDAGNYITKLPKAPKIKLSFQLTPLECGVASPADREPRIPTPAEPERVAPASASRSGPVHA